MTTLYKLTDQEGYTRKYQENACLWGPNISHTAKENTGGLCSGQYIHAYLNPHLAVIMNPVHADIKNPELWRAKGIIKISDSQLKVGCKTLTTLQEMPLPEITNEQKVTFAILCAKKVCKDPGFLLWADNWLSGKDRSAWAASAAWAAWAASAAWAAASAASAAWAAASAASAASAAAEAASAAEAAEAASAADTDFLGIIHQIFGGT